MRRLRDVFGDRRGATVVEYGLICALIFLAAVGAINSFGAAVIRMLYNVSNRSGAVM